jgi:succinyl-diaminopimelate desuccinylase
MPTTTITDTLTETLTHLVRFPTVTGDNATNSAALDWVEQQLQDLPLTIKRLENNGFPALIATTAGVKNPKNPRLWLAAHMDVVEAGSPDDFTPLVRNGRLYGRGTHDMKYSIAAYVTLLQELGSALDQYDLGLLITSDEEIGGEAGVGWLVNDCGYRGSAVLLPDTSAAWQAEVGGKGISRWVLTAKGKAGHASRPWEGINAVDELMRAVNQLRSNVPAEPCGDPQHRHASVNLSTLEGGSAINQIPNSATAQLDIRFPDGLTLAEINGWIEAATSTVPSVSARNIVEAMPYRVNATHPAMVEYETIAKEVTGHSIMHYLSHASADARWFAWKDVPVINVGITGSGYHTSPEWVDIADLAHFYEITHRFVDSWAKTA